MAEPRRILAFHGRFDRPGRKDVTYAFEPECEKLCSAVGDGKAQVHVINNRQPFAGRRRDTLAALGRAAKSPGAPFDTVAFFCHGWKHGMELGFNRANVGKLAAAIWKVSQNSLVNVPLYLCSAGGGPQNGALSFADALRDALCQAGATYCRVTAHSTVAHTTKNPHALFFDGMGSPAGGTGGYHVVAPRSALWKPWIRALRGTDLRFRYPFMTVAEIHAELLGS